MFSNRLKVARKMAGLSLEQLAERVGGITKQSLCNYENGTRKPDSTFLIKISNVLKVKPDFFFRENNVNLQSFEYRKKSSKLSQKEKNMIEEKVRDLLERYLELENLLGDFPRFENPLMNDSYKDIEQAVILLRSKWNLGNSPIKNLIETLEENGVRILEIDDDNDFDGLAVWDGICPNIVINSNKNDIVRRRMTVAHELGHLLFILPDNMTVKEKENLCFRFAGEFLIPRNVLIQELGEHRSSLTENELSHIKNEYGISIQGIIRHAYNIGIISKSMYINFCIKVRKNGWEKYEFGEYSGNESPVRNANMLFRAVSESIISSSKAASIANISESEFLKAMKILL
ncbi:MAG: XRE family transcriptional regulator [Bacteroidota bacterium]|nr:XRE family transcriptional regulator [Bacteroidota bacterium]